MVNYEELSVSLIPFKGVLGYLQILPTLQLGFLDSTTIRYHTNQESWEPKSVYQDFYKDKACLDHHGCSYTDYITQMIDKLVDQIDQGDADALTGLHQVEAGYWDHHTDSFVSDCSREVGASYQVAEPVKNATSPTHCFMIRDFNIQSKTVGYLALESIDFEFVGPDRLPVSINSIDTCLRADVILSTNKPNYCEARIPIVSGLKVKAWETYLQGYPDNRLMQYIRFGFPLSIHNSSDLHNSEVSNYYSAVQYPHDTRKYLDKEIELGAMLGPVEVVNHPEFHCSPLMSRPKEGDTRRVILDLSYPKGSSLNDHVSKDRFDGNLFALKLPSIDSFTQEIINTDNDPVLFKVDVARAFRNLPVDPADCLKFGLKVNNKFFMDKSVAFRWVHGTSSYQLISAAIAYIMKDQVNLHCYIDDYVSVHPRLKADKLFQNLCSLLHELGLPLNTAKLTPPPPH